ncbi:MAG: TIGR04282 family arsenosugar biosynthesis glycosyltransferase [Acidimicrobiales bacterium]
MDLVVLAKEPVPGRVKTRLCPPCSPAEAARVAAAALADTLDAALDSGADRVVLALDGRPGLWCPPGVVVVGQGHGALDRRLAHVWSHGTGRGPALQVGMDTPQVLAGDLDRAMAALVDERVDAVLGPATDGGWWALGMRHPRPEAVLGVPTGRPDTGARQAARLAELGLRTGLLDPHTDIDTWSDAVAVANRAPGTQVAAVVESLAAELIPAASGTGL